MILHVTFVCGSNAPAYRVYGLQKERMNRVCPWWLNTRFLELTEAACCSQQTRKCQQNKVHRSFLQFSLTWNWNHSRRSKARSRIHRAEQFIAHSRYQLSTLVSVMFRYLAGGNDSAFPSSNGSGHSKSLVNLLGLRILSSLLKSPESVASQVVQANAMYSSFRRICSSGALGVAAGRASHEEFQSASGQTVFFFPVGKDSLYQVTKSSKSLLLWIWTLSSVPELLHAFCLALAKSSTSFQFAYYRR